MPAPNFVAAALLTVTVLPERVSAPWEMSSAGWVVSPVKAVGVKVNETACDPRLTVPLEAPLIAAAVLPTAVPVPLALKVVLVLRL